MKEKATKPKKRKSEINGNASLLKKKKESEEYTEIHFKVELKDPNTRFLALDKFISEANKYLEDGGYDIIAGYCRSSEECTEITQLLDGGKRKPAELQLIFEALESILIRLADDLSKYLIVGQNIVKKVWGAYTGSIFTSLMSRNKASHIKTTLKLLTAMTMLGETSAKAILTQIDFSNQNMQMLFSRRDRKDPQDVRTCLIHFVLGFMISGSDSVIRQLMDIKDFSRGIFDGLCYDNIETVQLVLNTLLEKVVQNPVISKTQKVRMFNEESLKHLGGLYHWKGIQDWKKYDRQEKEETAMENEDDSNSEEKQMACESVHKVLMELCTSYKYGIIFFDKTVGTSQKNQNHILTSFLTSLTKVTETPLIQDLIVAALVACPDQLQYYLPSLQSSLTPRVSEKWISAMGFLNKIYSSQPDTFCISKIREVMPCRKLVQVILTTVIPPSQILHTVVQGLKHKDLVVRHTVLDLIKLMLRRSAALMKYLSSEGDVLSLYSQEEITEVTERVKEEILKAAPDIPSILLCWDKLMSQMKDKGNNSADIAKSEIETVPESSHMIRLEQVLSLYQDVFPSCLTDNPINISKIMEGVRYLTEQCGQLDTDSEEDTDYLPQLYLLKLLSGADSRKLPWVKESQEGHSLVYLLLEMLQKVKRKPQLVMKTQHLICQLLISTGLFDFNKEELSLWVRGYSCAITGSCDIEDLTNFISKVFTTFISNPYPFSDKVNDFVSEGMSLESTGTELDTLSIGTTDSNIDALLEMDEEDVDDKDEDIADDDPVLNQIRFPFSPLIIVAFDILKNSDADSRGKGRIMYLSRLLIDILHCQLNPFPLICLLQSYPDINIDEAVRSYIMCFSHPGKKSSKVVDVIPLSGEASCIFTQIFLSGKATTLSKLLAYLSEVTEVQAPMFTRQFLLYINHYLKDSRESKEVNKTMHTFFQGIVEMVRHFFEKDMNNLDGKIVSSHQQKEFQELEIKTKSNIEVIKDIIITVLKHPSILKWFLFVKDGSITNLSVDNKTICINTRSQFITECICDLVRRLKNSDIENFRPSFEQYVSKMEDLLWNIDKVKNHKKLSKVISLVQDILPILTKNLAVEKTSKLMEVILKVPKHFLIDQDQLSNLSMVAVELLSKLLNDSDDQLLKIDIKCVENLFHLQLGTQDKRLTDCCNRLLEEQPHLSIAVNSEILNSLMASDEDQSLNMVENVVLHNQTQAGNFRKQFQKGTFDERLEIITPIVLVLLRKIGHKTDESSRKWLKVVCKKYRNLTKSVCDLTAEHGEMQIQLIISLVNYGIMEKGKVFLGLMKSVTSHGLQNQHSVHLLHFLVENSTDHQKTLLNLFIKTVLDLQKTKENLNDDLSVTVIEKINVLLQNVSGDIDLEDAGLPKFIKVILKSRFFDKRTFQIISKLVHHVSDWPAELPLSTLHQMVMSHSLFLPIMFNEKFPDVKGDLCGLLLCLVESDSSCCSTQHYGIVLGSYMATLCDTDQKLLKLMYLYEKNECIITEYRPYLWGPKAIEHHSVQKTIGPSLLKKASVDQVIENFDQTKLYTSILNFPLRRKLQAFTVQDSRECKSIPDVYDPCFILPLFSHILSPDQLIDCRKFIERGCLGYLIAALSCHDNTMRGAAYHVLDNFFHQLEASRFPEKEQQLYVIELIRNSLDKANVKLPCIITVFLSKVVRLMLKAEQHMYQMMNTFLYLKPTLDVTNVPEFYKLFNSSTLEFKEERGWILNLLLDGLRETADYRTFEKRYTFKLLLNFFDTAISDTASQVLVLKIINRACQEKTVAMDLTRNHGINTWLINVINSSDSKRCEILIDIVHNLWNTMVGKKQETSNGKAVFLPPAFSRDILAACKELTKKFSDEASCMSAIKLLETMSSILQHLQFTCQQLESQGHIYSPLVLTLTDVKELYRITKLFSKCKKVTNEKGRKTDIEENKEKNLLLKKSENMDSIDETESKEEFFQLSPHKKLKKLALTIFLYWKPFSSGLLVGGAFSVIMVPSKDLCLSFLDICLWMMQEINSCKDIDLMEKVLQWASNCLKCLRDSDQYKVYFIKSVVTQMIDSLLQLYSVINNVYKDFECYGMEQSLERSVDCVNNILICIPKTEHYSETCSSLLNDLQARSEDLSPEAWSMVLKTLLLHT